MAVTQRDVGWAVLEADVCGQRANFAVAYASHGRAKALLWVATDGALQTARAQPIQVGVAIRCRMQVARGVRATVSVARASDAVFAVGIAESLKR